MAAGVAQPGKEPYRSKNLLKALSISINWQIISNFYRCGLLLGVCPFLSLSVGKGGCPERTMLKAKDKAPFTSGCRSRGQAGAKSRSCFLAKPCVRPDETPFPKLHKGSSWGSEGLSIHWHWEKDWGPAAWVESSSLKRSYFLWQGLFSGHRPVPKDQAGALVLCLALRGMLGLNAPQAKIVLDRKIRLGAGEQCIKWGKGPRLSAELYEQALGGSMLGAK